MSDTYIPIKKLADVHNNDFYPLSAAKGTITTEDIAVRNVLGGTYGDKVPASSNLYDILVQILGTEFKTGIDLDIQTLSDSKERAPSSYLLKKLLISILGGDLNLKFKVCTYQEYQQWLEAGTIDDNTLYFTTGSGPTPVEYWIITFDANGGTVSETTRLVAKGNPYGTLPIPVYSGYNFQGWYTAPSGGIKIIETNVPNSNIILYAHWSAISEDDLLCIEENHSKLVITEDKKYNIKLNKSIEPEEPILATEGDHIPVITEDKKYNISLKNSSEPVLATEIIHDPVVTEDKQNGISLKDSSDPLLATEIQKDLVSTEDNLNNINLKTTTCLPSMSVSALPKTQNSISQLVSAATKRKTRKRRSSK